MATKLNLKRYREQEIRLVTFGSDKSKVIKTTSTKLKVKLLNGKELLITANIVPSITGTIQRKPVKIDEQRTLQGDDTKPPVGSYNTH